MAAVLIIFFFCSFSVCTVLVLFVLNTRGEISEEMHEFIQHSRMIFKNGLDRELYLLEDKAIVSSLWYSS